jgi:hypothetical protein
VGAYADPVPQALILTAIVIGFGVLAFTLALAYRAYQTVGSDDLDDMKATDQIAVVWPGGGEPDPLPGASEPPIGEAEPVASGGH